MKVIFLILSLTVLTSCNDIEYKVGDCIQKPDESIVWKINELSAGSAVVQPSGKIAPEMVKEIQIDSTWIKARCR